MPFPGALLAIVALLLPSGFLDLKLPPREGVTLEMVSLEPAPGSTVTPGTAITGEFRYAIENFRKGEYFLMAQFVEAGEKTTTGGGLPRERIPALRASSGNVSVSYPLRYVWRKRNVRQPFVVYFFLNHRSGGGKSEVVAMAGPFEYVPAPEH